MAEQKKFVFNLRGTVAEALENLAASQGISRTEAISRALALYDYVLRELKAGKEEQLELGFHKGTKVVKDVILPR